MLNTYFEDFGELLESDESDEFFESDEARRRPSRTPVRTAKRGNPVPKAAVAGYATKAELQATANKLDARIGTNSKAIAASDRRARSVEADQIKMRSLLKREITERKSVSDGLKRGLDESRQLAMLLPLLSTQETVSVNLPGIGQTDVVVDSGDTFSKILPLLLLSGGMGGSSATGAGGGGLFGGGGDSMMPLIMILALTGKK